MIDLFGSKLQFNLEDLLSSPFKIYKNNKEKFDMITNTILIYYLLLTKTLTKASTVEEEGVDEEPKKKDQAISIDKIAQKDPSFAEEPVVKEKIRAQHAQENRQKTEEIIDTKKKQEEIQKPVVVYIIKCKVKPRKDLSKQNATQNSDEESNGDFKTKAGKQNEANKDIYIEMDINGKKSKITIESFRSEISNKILTQIMSKEPIGFVAVSFGIKNPTNPVKIPDDLVNLRKGDFFEIQYAENNMLTITKNGRNIFSEAVAAVSAENLRKAMMNISE